METYKITIAENISYRQFVGFIEAETEEEAIKKAKEQFVSEKPIYNGRFRVIMCHKIKKYLSKGGFIYD